MDRLISIPEHSYFLDSLQINSAGKWNLHIKFVKFCRQNLELWMFVPCDLENDPLLHPGSAPIYTHSNKYMREYKKAKERVLFEGIEYVEAKHEGSYNIVIISKSLSTINYPEFWKNKTIEDLIPYNLELTPTAQKQIGL